MAKYCSECGSEISDVNFCPDCGTKIQKQTTDSVDSADSEDTIDVDELDEPTGYDKYKPKSVLVGIAAFCTAIIVGFTGYMAIFSLWESGWLFLLVFMSAFVYLSQQDYPSEAIGIGLYISALFVLLFPVIFYIDMIVAAEGQAGGEFAQLGGIFGLFIWGIIGLIMAIIVAGIGYLFNRRAKKQAESGS